MTKLTRLAGIAGAAVLASAVSASAATLSLIGATGSQVIANNDLGLGLNGSSVDYITGDLKTVLNGLSLNDAAKITYTYLGFEAGNSNFAAVMGATSFVNGVSVANVSSTSVTQTGAGLLDFAFGTSNPQSAVGLFENDGVANPASINYAMGFLMISPTSYYVLFDDIAAGDRDFDDIGIRIDVAPVPVPAAGMLLIGGLGVMGLVARRRKA